MAPSSRKSRIAHTPSQPVLTAATFGRVSKSNRSCLSAEKVTKKQEKAIVELLSSQSPKEQEKRDETRLGVSKRKRDDDSDDEISSNPTKKLASTKQESRSGASKSNTLGARTRQKLHLPTPPTSQNNTDNEASSPIKAAFQKQRSAARPVELPEALQELVLLHAAFLKALSLHYAHNGASAPAELANLTMSMTRIWRKTAVSRVMMQRLLAVWEIADSSLDNAKTIEYKLGQFKLVAAGLGLNVRTNLEYVGTSIFSEQTLQAEYERRIQRLSGNNPSVTSTIALPLLAIELGSQTAVRQAKAATTRSEILSLSSAAQSRSALNFSSLSINDGTEQTPASVKSRTLSLFDRVRAKGLANSSSNAPTSEQLTRRHAIGRLPEVVEFLRMKQQQKLASQFQSAVHDDPGSIRGKVSFSLNSIVSEIRQSVGVPMGEDEVRVCVKILAHDVPDLNRWLSIFELGTVSSVTLVGSGLSGIEVKRMIEAREETV